MMFMTIVYLAIAGVSYLGHQKNHEMWPSILLAALWPLRVGGMIWEFVNKDLEQS